MDQHETSVHIISDSRTLAHALARYREPNSTRSVLEIVITAAPFALNDVLVRIDQ